MTDHSLPDDLEKWPENPFDLLGVKPGCTLKDLKRSYTRLIRAFKPEHHPGHFRRIRDAFEHVQRYLELFSQFDHSENVADEPTIPTEARREAAQEPNADSRAGDHPDSSNASAPETVDSLWTLAIQGEEERAYRGLVSLYERGPSRPAVLIRLYWLLLLNPSFDLKRQPADWLVSGLAETRLMGTLAEAYHQFVQWFPTEAFSERFDRLLLCDAAPARLAEILGWRWQQALRRESWNIVAVDLELWRKRIQPFEDEGWLQLLLQVMDTTAWTLDPGGVELYRLCREELKSYQHLSVRRGEWFDRWEYLEELAKAWLRARESDNHPRMKSFLDVLRLSWTRPLVELDAPVRRMIEAIHADHLGCLKLFDEMSAAGAVLVVHFNNILRNYEDRREAYNPQPADPNAFVRFVEETIESFGYNNLAQSRLELLRLCTREWIQIEWLEPLLMGWIEQQELPPYQTRAVFAAKVMNDWSLRLVCWAERLFWA